MSTQIIGAPKYAQPPKGEPMISSLDELDEKIKSLKKGDQATIYCSPSFVRAMGGQDGIVNYIKNKDKMAAPDFSLEELETAEKIISAGS